MDVVPKIAIGVLALSLCGCEMRPWRVQTPPAPQSTVAQAPPPPSPPSSEPLSIPQTQVALPPLQPIDPEALATPPISVPAESPSAQPARKNVKRSGPFPPPGATAKPEPVESADAPAADPQRAPIEPVLPADQRHQLTEDIASRLRDVDQLLNKSSTLRLSATEKDIVDQIRSFEALSQKALEKGDLPQAAGLAKRALLMAQELLSGK